MKTSKRSFLALIALVVASATQAVHAEAISDLFERVRRSVVVVRTVQVDIPAEDGEAANVSSLGSGVLVSADGKILTAAHLVQAAAQINVEFSGGQRVAARVISSAPGAEIALLQVAAVPSDALMVRLADSDAARIGEQVFIIGAPFGLSYTLSVGHLSGRQKHGQTTASLGHAEFLLTNAAINKGNSGGPMFDMAGDVLGIVSSILTISGGFEGLGRAVAANVARELVLDGDTVPWLGIDGLFLTENLQKILNLSGSGILVQRVVPSSAGARLGLRGGFVRATLGDRTIILGGDVMVKVQGIAVGEEHTPREQLRKLRPGDTLSVTIIREGRLQELSTVLPR